MAWPIAPMKASTGRLPHGDVWMFEPKWDGHRALVRWRDGALDAVSSTGQARMQRWPWIAGVSTVLAADCDEVILDGEAIAIGEDGKHSFQLVGRPDRPHAFVVFDVLSSNGRSLLTTPWHERRALLEATVTPNATVWLTPVTDDGDALMSATRANGFEGVIAKRRDSIYLPGRRTPTWIKVKHRLEQEVVIGGYLSGEGSRSKSFGSLLVGVHDAEGHLQFAGGVGTGFNEKSLRELWAALQERGIDACPFVTFPATVPKGRAHWVRPELVAQIQFGEWTQDNILRHSVYLGLRDDKPAAEVIRET